MKPESIIAATTTKVKSDLQNHAEHAIQLIGNAAFAAGWTKTQTATVSCR